MAGKIRKLKSEKEISDLPEGEVSDDREKSALSDGRRSVFVRISDKAQVVLNEAAKAPRTRGTVIEALLENLDKEKDPNIRERILNGQIDDPLRDLSQNAKDILDAAAKAPWTKGMVIEALLENFAREKDPVIRDRILRGQVLDPLKEHGELLELRSWAEHAFQNQRYVWAAGMYELLAKHPSSSAGVKNICRYRLSVCLIRLSYEIRDEALGELDSDEPIDKETFGVALRTLDTAINYTMSLQEKLGPEFDFPKLVLYYNLASCHSLKAQYIVESELNFSTQRGSIESLRQAGKKPEFKEKAWEAIGKTWRDSMETQFANSEAEKAYNALLCIVPSFSDRPALNAEDFDLPYDKEALVNSARTDEDFIFLRSDTHAWQARFNDWASLVTGRKSTANAVRTLLDRLPSRLGN